MNQLEPYLIEHCSPTLASLKTANLFRFSYSLESELYDYIELLNQQFSSKGVSITILQRGNESALIYVYRKQKLEKDLQKSGVLEFLSKYGYLEDTAESAIKLLQQRFGESEEFPHEIGLFLGYPLGDVIGFIENAGKYSKCVGCWKVYCNEYEAVKMFAKFAKCSNIYKKLWNEGRSIWKLTVPA